MLPTRVRFDPSIERCGVRFFFNNNEDEEVVGQDFEERSGSDITSDTISDEEEQYLKLSEVFEGKNRALDKEEEKIVELQIKGLVEITPPIQIEKEDEERDGAASSSSPSKLQSLGDWS
ncbi:hypothetical protein ACLB2K_069475 [Fragaria x ananassa]